MSAREVRYSDLKLFTGLAGRPDRLEAIVKIPMNTAIRVVTEDVQSSGWR